MLLRQAPFVDRNNFPFLLNDRQLCGSAVEVGTHRGDYAQLFLQNWRGAILYCVDPWQRTSGPNRHRSNSGYGDRSGDLQRSIDVLRPWITLGRCRILRDRSPEVSYKFKDGTLDFVYLDGDHRCEAVAADLWAWWLKIRSGGILGGHDFVSQGTDVSSADVQPAVLAFAENNCLDVWMVTETLSQPWSFYLQKP